MSTLKILLLTTQFPPHVGGVPSFYYYLTNEMSKEEISILTAKEDGWETIDKNLDFSIHRTAIINKFKTDYKFSYIAKSIFLFLQTLMITLKDKIGIIILGTSDVTLMFICYLTKIILGKKYIIFNHGDGESPNFEYKRKKIEQFFYKKAEAIIVNSHFTKNRLINKYSIPYKKIYVLHPGVDIKKFYPMDASALKKELHVEDKKIILTIGRLDKRKGHDMVLRALPAVIKEIRNVFYLIVGKGKNKVELDSLSKEIAVSDYIKFVDPVESDELAKFYNICDIFIMANRELKNGDTEGFGMVFIEANACGKPVIGGNSGGAPEAIKDNETGLLVDPYDINDIARKIIYLLKNKEIADRVGRIGLERARREYNWDTNIKNNFRELINEFVK